jgi:hypothetical protein
MEEETVKRRAAALLLAWIALAAARVGAEPAQGWQRAETEHFLFVFEPANRLAADQLLGFSEEVYAQVTGFLGSLPARSAKIPCIVHGNTDYANGSTSPFPGRIDLFVTAPSDHSMGARTGSWLRLLFTHELTHFVHLSMDRGPFAALSRVFGSDVAMGSAIFLPGWMVEGAAVNLETRLTEGGRGRSPLFEIFSKAPVIDDDLFSLRQAGYDSSFPPAGRIYVAGQILVDYLLEEFGPDALARIMEAYLPFPFFGPWAAIEKVTGRKAAVVYAEMKQALAARHAPAAALPAGALLTPDAVGDWRRPQATARGLYLYRSAPDRVPAIVRLDPASGKEQELARVTLTDAGSFSATADGATVWFTSLVYDWRRPGTSDAVSELYRMDAHTRKIARVTTGGRLWQPAVSPDGSRVAAVQADGPYSRLVSVDPATGAVTGLYSRPGTNVYSPAFSPDGGSLVFTLNDRGFQDICLLRVADEAHGSARLLPGPDRSGEYYPAFLDGQRVVFSSDRTGSLCLYVVDTVTGDLALVLEDPVAAISAVADGGSLVYQSYRSRGFCLRQVPLAGLEARPVAAPPAEEIPGEPQSPGAAAEARPFHDLPLPYVWYPWVPFSVTPTGVLDAALGAQALGGSLLGVSSWSLGLAWHPLTSQPRAELVVSTAVGSLRVDASAAVDHAVGTQYVEDAGASLLLTLPLLWRHELGSSLGLFARTRLVLDARLERVVPFDLADVLSAGAAEWGRSLWIVPGVAAHWVAARADRDLYPSREVEASLDLVQSLPAFPPIGPSQRLLLYLSGSLPSPAPHHVLKLGAKASWTVGAAGTYIDGFAAPRGAFSGQPRTGPGVVLASLDYLAPVALLDVPVVLGLGLTGLGIGAHVEWAGGFGVVPGFLRPDAELFVGLEALFQFTAGIQPFPAGVGLAARIRTDGSGFDPAADLRPYIFFSVDSFADAARARPGRP